MFLSTEDIIKRAVLRTVKHIHDEGYSRLILSGRSHIVAKNFFEAGWKHIYQNDNFPEFDIFDAEINAVLYKGNALELPDRLKLVSTYIEEKLPNLEKCKNDKLGYLEEFSASGCKYRTLKERFGMLGFTHLNFNYFLCRSILEDDVFIGDEDNMQVANYLYTLTNSLNGISGSNKSKIELVSNAKETIYGLSRHIEKR